jgi:hypothetical protein
MPIYTSRYVSQDIDGSALTNTYRHIPNTKEDIETKGELHCLITVIGDKDIQADRVAKFVWDTIVDTYYFSSFKSVIDNLKASVELGSKKATELIKNGEKNSFNLSFALSVFKGKGAYLTVFGEQQMLLFKNGGFVKVSDIVTQNKGVVASMAWANDDLLILGSPNVLDGFTEVVKMGNSSAEVCKTVEFGSKNLVAYQSILLISGFPITVEKNVEPLKVKPPVIQEKPVEIVEEPIVETPIISNVDEVKIDVKKKRPKINFKKYIDLAKSYANTLVTKLKPIVKKIGSVLGNIPVILVKFVKKIALKINSTVSEKYGRAQWYKKMMAKFSTFNFMKKKSGIGIKIDGYKDNDLRKKRFAILFYLILGIVSVYFLVQTGIRSAEDKKVSKELNAIIQIHEKKLEEIWKIKSSDKEQAATDLFTLKEDIELIKDSKKPADVEIKYQALLTNVNKLDDEFLNRKYISEKEGELKLVLDGRVRFGENTSLVDISPFKDDFQNEFLLITDYGNGAVYKFNLNDGTVASISDSKKLVKKPKYIDYGNEGVYVYDEQAGVLTAKFGNSKAIGNMASVSGLDNDIIGNSEIVDLSIMGALDSVFLLNRTDASIMKSSKSGSGYSYPTAYLSSKTFSTANNLANDLSLYVMTSGLKGIERYSNTSKGYAPNRITLEDLSGTPTIFTAGFTSPNDGSKFYAFDKSENRVLEFEKPIEFGATPFHPNQFVLLNQFIFKGDRQDVFSDVKELATDYFEKFLYILDGNRIWQLKLK